MLREALVEPPELLAQTVNCVVVIRCVGMPHIVPLLVSKVKPVGKSGAMAHEVISPGPVRVAFNGKSLLGVLFSSVRFSGKYESVGVKSLTTMVNVVVSVPPEFRAVMV